MPSRNQSILINFHEGRRLHSQQEQTLGQSGVDKQGNFRVYGQFKEAGSWAEGFRHAGHVDLSVDNPTEVTSAAAVGTDEITASGEAFTDVIEGAYFQVTVGGGTGQMGIVLKRLSATKIKVAILYNNDGPTKSTNQTIQTALTTASRLEFFMPGYFYKADGAATDYNAGVCEIAGGIGADDLDKFGWLRQTGLGPGRLGAALAAGRGGSVKFDTNGRIVEFDHAATSTDDPAQIVGRSFSNVIGAGASDIHRTWINWDIPEHPVSTLVFDREHPYNKVVITN